MKPCLQFLIVLALLLSTWQPLNGQNVAAPQDPYKIRIGTAEVALDVVVRDKKGRPVRDLAAADFEIYEDGVRQQLDSFRLVLREAGLSNQVSRNSEKPETPAATAAKASADVANSGVIALVFDRLTPEARAWARRAATAYAEENLLANDFTGVFAVDLSVQTLQSYTDNPQLVKQAIEQATGKSISTFASNTERSRNLAGRNAALSSMAETAAGASATAGRDGAGAAASGEASGRAILEQAFIQMESRMLETFETLERNQQGYATVNGLLSLVNSMRNLPGRKSVIFFSEGLSLPPAVVAQFTSVINAANRANVSVYAVDAAGLRIESPTLEASREINSMAQRRMNQAHQSRDDTSGPMMKALERNEDLLRLNPQTGLSQLADQTGGFLISNTNDLVTGLRRIDEDMRVHYLLTYTPKNQEYDGRFRQLTVKLARPNLDVQTRKGYYAVDNSIASPVLNYEAPVLAALSAARKTQPFALQLGALTFPEANRLGLAPVLVEAPAAAFTYSPDKEKKTYSTDFSILVLIRDEAKQVVEKLSQHYLLSGSLDQLAAAKKGEILFYREADLAPGHYTVEAVAYDAPTAKASVSTTSLEVSAGDAGKLRLSSLMLLKRADRLTAEEQKKEHPLHFGEVLVYPNLGEPVHKTAKQLAFFLTAWPAQAVAEKPKLTLEVLQNGRRLAQIPAELPAADAQGKIKYASALPLESFPPGTYELRATVSDGQNSATRSTHFSVEP
jgi:VWFA-related protein